MNRMTTFKYHQESLRQATIEVNGKDVAAGVRAFAITAGVGEVPVVELEVAAWRMSSVEADTAIVRLANSSTDLLLELGWTPPGEKALIEVRELRQIADIIDRLDAATSHPGQIAELIRVRADRREAEAKGGV